MIYRICSLLAVVLSVFSSANLVQADQPRPTWTVTINDSNRENWNVAVPPSEAGGFAQNYFKSERQGFSFALVDGKLLFRLGYRGNPLRIELYVDTDKFSDLRGNPDYAALRSIMNINLLVTGWASNTCSELKSLKPKARQQLLAQISKDKSTIQSQIALAETSDFIIPPLSEPIHAHYKIFIRTMAILSLQDAHPECKEDPTKLALNALTPESTLDPYLLGPVPAYGGP